jgi:hypothetical protein
METAEVAPLVRQVAGSHRTVPDRPLPDPHPEFADAAPYLGGPPGPCPIRFGRDDLPFSICGPDDNPRAVVNALEATAGPGNYHYIAHLYRRPDGLARPRPPAPRRAVGHRRESAVGHVRRAGCP